MLKNSVRNYIAILMLHLATVSVVATAADDDGCNGDYPNPISDICWYCIFPIEIGGIKINGGAEGDNGDSAPPFVCQCPAPPPLFVRYGVGIAYWEPARISEVVRRPMCSPTLGGTNLGDVVAPRGNNSEANDEQGQAFYHVHWIQYPVLNWLGMAIQQGVCASNETYDMLYLSELDVYWEDDELAFILSPEAALFTSVPTQAACVADSVKAAVTDFGIDALFWCSGSQGSLFPISGTHAAHVGGIDSALAVTHSMIFKLHREFIAHDTSTYGAICGSQPQPTLRKNQYKTQLIYPVPWTYKCYGFGAQSTIWGSGKEFPYRGEEFAYLVWRKRMCCAW